MASAGPRAIASAPMEPQMTRQTSRPRSALPLLLSALALLAACGLGEGKGPTVLAASSLQGPLDEAADAWVKAGHARPVLSYAGTPTLARQVEAGAPADLVVTADGQWMDELARRDRIEPDSQAVLATNTLVLIQPSSAPSSPASEAAMRRTLEGSGRIAMADPDSVPAGRYGKAAITSLGQWPTVASRVVPTDNVRAALALVERGAAPLGVVYATDARASAKVRVLWHFEAGTHPLIVYPLARVRGSRGGAADDFRRFLLGPPGQRILARHGFGPPPS